MTKSGHLDDQEGDRLPPSRSPNIKSCLDYLRADSPWAVDHNPKREMSVLRTQSEVNCVAITMQLYICYTECGLCLN